VHERREVALGKSGRMRLRHPVPPPGQHQAGCRESVVLTEDEVGREVARRPRFEQGRRVGTELDEEVAQLVSLECVEQHLGHAIGLYPPIGPSVQRRQQLCYGGVGSVGVSTSDEPMERDLAGVLNELIDLVREIKQIEWVAHGGTDEARLEELDEFLVPQVDAIARLEATSGSPLNRIVTPSARRRAPLSSSPTVDVVRDQLVPHLRAVSSDVRTAAQDRAPAEAAVLNQLADGLARSADELSS